MIVTIASGDREYSHSSKSECNHCGGEVPETRHVYHVDFDKTSVDAIPENLMPIVRPSPSTCGCGNGETIRSHRHSPHYNKDHAERFVYFIFFTLYGDRYL